YLTAIQVSKFRYGYIEECNASSENRFKSAYAGISRAMISIENRLRIFLAGSLIATLNSFDVLRLARRIPSWPQPIPCKKTVLALQPLTISAFSFGLRRRPFESFS